ncbi:Smr/MutS family protein [Maridesulfovibrio hydrothermalis]|uniref:Smr protein/MutS2 n=1 Tax=Maridesulfovibrio hydrothermalis AM13 = DSM 14728 TaxID=1121451 RepID=L0RCG3_9BACT|nr:Smr/MutS family protein [Maridesulfovibrio hydrothermalis]CCO24463.1 Smr protein/MutS2 [Maridesulfovibrio hydrothermalis AM13 = DSM 14728]
MAKKRMNSLSDLKSLKFKENKKEPEMSKAVKKALAAVKKKPAPVKTDEKEIEPVNDDMAFMNAMSGVQRMDSSTVVVEKSNPAPVVSSSDEDDGKKYLSSLISGKIEFEIEYSDEFMFGFVRGTDSKIFQKLKSGAFSHEAHIDLHGMNSEQAFDNLLFFIRESFLQGNRCVLAVTGRGKNSPGGHSVLKREIQDWLTRDPFRRVVLAFCTAQPKDGGAGAVYILLRKQKKVQGKVKWDKGINWGKDF